MFIPFITTVMQLFASIFMKFFSFPLGDLGFNLDTLMIFLILLRFAFRVILPEKQKINNKVNLKVVLVVINLLVVQLVTLVLVINYV